MTATRRLAAILAADVVGYSRLIGADEEGTLKPDKVDPGERNRPEDRRPSWPDRQDDG